MAVPGIGRTATGGVSISMSFQANWNGEQFKRKVTAANEAAVMAAAEETMIAAKAIVHRVSGVLRRSIKVDRPDEVRDRTQAAQHRDVGHPIPRPKPASKPGGVVTLAVGGTTFYALYEELLHPYMEPAVQQAVASGKIMTAAKDEM